MIPQKTIGLLDKLGNKNLPSSIGKPVTVKTPLKHSIPSVRGPWKVAPPPTDQQKDDNHLFRLIVNKDKKKSWRIDVTDLIAVSTRAHCSGFGAPFSMNGQVKSGAELAEESHSG